MTGCGHGWAVRAGIAVLLAGALLAGGASISEAASPIKLSVQIGYRNQLIKPGQWMPVSVDITNSGPNFDGMLEIENSNTFAGKGGPPGGIAVYQTPVSLATGATKHFRTYVTQDIPGTVDVRVVQSGHIVASQSVGTGSNAGLLVGVLSDQSATLDELSAVHPGGYQPLVAHLQSADLSDSSLILRAFDMIAIDDFATDTLTAAQRNAISDYVINGGSLFLGAGGAWHKTLGGLPDSMLPMQVTGSTVLSSVKALDGLTNVEVATGTIQSGSTIWLSEGRQPLLIEKRVGQGIVSLATFDWVQARLAGFNTSTALLRQAFVRATYGMGQNPGGTPGVVTKFGFTTSLASKGGQFSQALANLPALSLPAWWLIGALVLIYVLLVGPINYVVLRAINRRALAWVTVPVLALVGSAGAYGASVITKGTSVQTNQVSVVHVQPGWDRAYQEAYTGVLTPTRGDYEVGITTGRPMISPIYNYYGGGVVDPSQAVVRINTANDAITLPGMTAFVLRGFATEGMTAAPRLQGSAQLVGGSIVASIQNLSSIHFTDGVVISGSVFQKFGKLEPNGSFSFSIVPGTVSPFTGPPAYMSIYPNMYSCCGPQPNIQSEKERDAEIRTAVLGTLPNTGFNGFAASVNPTVVLWTNQPFQDITVNGNHPRSHTQSAVVLTLPVTQIGAGVLPPAVIVGRMVDLDADIQSQVGPPGVFVTQAGTVTYEFEPNLSPGTHLTSATISSLNMFGAKGVPGSVNGSAPTVRGQVWDWAQSAWIDVSYVDSGTTTVPAAAVNLDNGAVRLQLRSDGPFSSGYLSLEGTVR